MPELPSEVRDGIKITAADHPYLRIREYAPKALEWDRWCEAVWTKPIGANDKQRIYVRPNIGGELSADEADTYARVLMMAAAQAREWEAEAKGTEGKE